MGVAFESVKRGLQQAIAHQQGKQRGVKVHRPRVVDVKQVRARTGLTQSEFATAFAISLGTLRHWERGDRTPRGTALVLLNIIERQPRAVLKALEVRSGSVKRANPRSVSGVRRTTKSRAGARIGVEARR